MSNPVPTPPFDDVRMRGFSSRTSVEDVIHSIRTRLSPLEAEIVRFDEAVGRVLTLPVVANVPVPHFDRAAFDGYAVQSIDTARARNDQSVTLRVIGEAMPDRPFSVRVNAGEAVRIMTGSPMPVGTDAVLPAEHSIERDGAVIVSESVDAGKNVGRIGEDVPLGKTMLRPGRILRPQDAGLLSSIGVAEIQVVRRPRVAVFVTGNEVLPPGSRPEGYRIVDSNSVVLNALIRRDGGEALPTRSLPDNHDVIRDAMKSSDWDVLIVSGGTSVGREDYAPKIVAELGELIVHGVAVRPGTPMGIGLIDGRPVFLLPGNPVACLCTYDLFAGRAVRILGRRSHELPYRKITRPLARRLKSIVGRVEYARVTVGANGVEPVPSTGASILSSTVIADGFVLVPPERDGIEPGELVEVNLYDN